MIRFRFVMLLVMLCVAAGVGMSARAADWSGTWVGVTQVPDVGEDRLKLELRADGDSYTGLMTDAAGIVVANPITKLKVEGALLTFDIVVNNGSAEFAVHVSMKADGDTLAGTWATDDGLSAPLTLTRQK